MVAKPVFSEKLVCMVVHSRYVVAHLRCDVALPVFVELSCVQGHLLLAVACLHYELEMLASEEESLGTLWYACAGSSG
jgi:hypothetical protein